MHHAVLVALTVATNSAVDIQSCTCTINTNTWQIFTGWQAVGFPTFWPHVQHDNMQYSNY